MRTLLCRWFGHRWAQYAQYAPKAYACIRCGETGSKVSS